MKESFSSVSRVAVVQATPLPFQLETTLQKVEQWTARAAARGAGLVLFPESFIPAYPRGLSFGTVVGHRSEAGRDQWLRFWRDAVSIPGPLINRLGEMASTHGVYLAIGVTERDEEGYTLFCSLLFFDPGGHLMGKHRKIKPTGSERLIWGEGAGDDLDVWSTPLGKTGGLICWENYLPLARMALYEQGVELYLAPTADQRDSWQATLRHIACEGRCFVLSANQFVPRATYPESWKREWTDAPELLCRGGSAIVDPYGNYLAGPLFDEEGLLFAELDGDELLRSKMDFDVNGHYARPDLFEFKWPRKARK